MQTNKINRLFQDNPGRKLLSLYFCAGSPSLEGTAHVIETLERKGIDMIEVGIPFSDPLADGPVIQTAATKALKNGMTLKKLFSQLEPLKDKVQIPLLLMGYLNVILHYGPEKFCADCARCGIAGAIIPDLPFKDYLETFKPIADRYQLRIIMMITPETSDERIRFIDEHTDGFIYMVSSASITGSQQAFDKARLDYFRRIDAMKLKNPRMIGFGISNRQTLESARQYAAGAIIGSKFVSLLDELHDPSLALDQLYDALEH
ncbi:MAG: tryptophan synthase subunit alpha [Bacteroidales bacterium]|nr:tryptophan synthase subunit alpha [Bacteroidales bacterium]